MDKYTVSRVVEEVMRCAAEPAMTLELAKILIQRIEEKAEETGICVVIAVADREARPVAVHSMDNAYIASFDIAMNKAYTSAGLKMSTEQLAALSGPGQPLYGIQHTNQGKIVIFGGGEVLKKDGKIWGALGVSGGSAQQDTALAAYGGEIFPSVWKDMINRQVQQKGRKDQCR